MSIITRTVPDSTRASATRPTAPVRRALVRVLAVAPIFASTGCNRESLPAYVPPPPPAAEAPPPPPTATVPSATVPSPPAAPTGEQLTIARACATDVERFCAGVPPRQGMIKECMKAHVTELSAGCFDAVMSAVAAARTP